MSPLPRNALPPWLPWTAAAALLIGAATGVVLLPSSDRSRALVESIHPDVDVRDAAWQWLADYPPGGNRPRLLVLLDDDPAALTGAWSTASKQDRRDATAALLQIEGFDMRLAPVALRVRLIEALLSGTPDEQALGRSLQRGTLQEAASQVNMQQ